MKQKLCSRGMGHRRTDRRGAVTFLLAGLDSTITIQTRRIDFGDPGTGAGRQKSYPVCAHIPPQWRHPEGCCRHCEYALWTGYDFTSP